MFLYIIPAMLQMGWAVLVICFGLFRIVALATLIGSGQVDPENVVTMGSLGGLTALVLQLVLNPLVIVGSIAMVRRKNLFLAKTAAVIVTIPCFGCFLFPVGIWTCVLLFGTEAKQDFT